MEKCEHCGNMHDSITCPRIKTIEYYPGAGGIKRIEFHAPAAPLMEQVPPVIVTFRPQAIACAACGRPGGHHPGELCPVTLWVQNGHSLDEPLRADERGLYETPVRIGDGPH